MELAETVLEIVGNKIFIGNFPLNFATDNQSEHIKKFQLTDAFDSLYQLMSVYEP